MFNENNLEPRKGISVCRVLLILFLSAFWFVVTFWPFILAGMIGAAIVAALV